MTKKPMIMGFFTVFAKLFEKYADVTVCEDGLELEETIEKVLASLN